MLVFEIMEKSYSIMVGNHNLFILYIYVFCKFLMMELALLATPSVWCFCSTSVDNNKKLFNCQIVFLLKLKITCTKQNENKK